MKQQNQHHGQKATKHFVELLFDRYNKRIIIKNNPPVDQSLDLLMISVLMPPISSDHRLDRVVRDRSKDTSSVVDSRGAVHLMRSQPSTNTSGRLSDIGYQTSWGRTHPVGTGMSTAN